MTVLAAILDEVAPTPETVPAPTWLGTYQEPETGLAVRIDRRPDGQVRLRYGHSAEALDMRADGSADNGTTRLRAAADGLWMDRPQENQSTRLRPADGASAADVTGSYRCAELGCDLTVTDAGGVLYGGFSGMLGQGRMELLDPVGPDLWALPCPRALDHTPPGDWTLAFRRDGSGTVTGVTVGCWLARGLTYQRVGPA
jgi:D-aminopeptidase